MKKRKIFFVQLCLSASSKPLPSSPFSSGAEVVGQNRGSLLNIRTPTSNPTNHPGATQTPQLSRVPVKRPSIENEIPSILIQHKMGPTTTTSNNHRRRTILPKNSLFEIGKFFVVRPSARKFLCYAGVPIIASEHFFQPIDLCFVSMFFSKNSTFLLKVLHSAQKNY